MAPKIEIPKLKALGLYAADTAGNGILAPSTKPLHNPFGISRYLHCIIGNCLFNALSDQLFGDQSHHVELRGATVDYIRSKPDHFKQFITVFPGGGIRRNPKRKNPGSLSNRSDLAGPTPTEIEASFQRHLKTMAQGGAYGDNMEISAFASRFQVEVWIYEEGSTHSYSVKPGHGLPEATRTAYIVHHVSIQLLLDTEMHVNLISITAIRTFLIHQKHRWPSHWASQCPLRRTISRSRSHTASRALQRHICTAMEN